MRPEHCSLCSSQAAGTLALPKSESTYTYFLDSNETLLAVEQRPSGSGTFFTRRYSPATGWDAGVAVDGGNRTCASVRFAYRSGYLLETPAGYLYNDGSTGCCNVPALPGAGGPATALKITSAADQSVIGARIVGVPAAQSQLQVFELVGTAWQRKSEHSIGTVHSLFGTTPTTWSNAMAYLYAGGVMAWAQFTTPFSDSNSFSVTESVELAGDRATASLEKNATCVQGTGCFRWSVLPDGSLAGFDGRARSIVSFYKRSGGTWTYPIKGEPFIPTAGNVKLDPAFVHSSQSAVFTTRCTAGSGFCEGREFVRFVRTDGTSRVAQIDNLEGVLSPSGTVADFHPSRHP